MIVCIHCKDKFPCREFYEYHWLMTHELEVIPKNPNDRVKAKTLERILNWIRRKP